MAIGKKTGGRKQGTPNRSTKQMRELLAEFLQQKWPSVMKAFDKLSPKEKVLAFSRLLPFTTPQYSNVNFSLSNMPETDLEFLIEKLKEQMNEQSETD